MSVQHEPHVQTTAKMVGDAIERFISDHERHSNQVELRWLAEALRPTLAMVGEVISQRGLGPELRAKVKEFRKKELLAELDAKQLEIIRIENEIKRVA